MDSIENRASIMKGQGAREQVILSTRVATGICLRGLRTRLGRSIVTLLGVALGISFLMAVISGFHIKQAMKAETELRRAVDRRIGVLRSEIGRVAEKSVLIVHAAPDRLDRDFLAALRERAARVELLTEAPGASSAPAPTDTLVLLGNYHALLDRIPFGLFEGRRAFVYDEPAADVRAAATEAGVKIKPLGIALRPDELARQQQRERDALYRTAWIVTVSLLITVGSIMNAMLMSVAERFREIGTMKCLGALSGFVVKLFLIESSLVGLAGSIVGALAGAILPLLAYGYSFGFKVVFTAVHLPTLVGYGAGCVGIGVVLAVLAGIYPARVAARMIPAMALASDV